MKQEGEELRPLVDHLAWALQSENRQAGEARSEEPAASVDSVARRSQETAQDLSPQPSDAWPWQDWRIRRIGGGMNGRLFRASGPAGDVAVKFAVRDERDRAGREWAALTMLAENLATQIGRAHV